MYFAGSLMKKENITVLKEKINAIQIKSTNESLLRFRRLWRKSKLPGVGTQNKKYKIVAS